MQAIKKIFVLSVRLVNTSAAIIDKNVIGHELGGIRFAIITQYL